MGSLDSWDAYQGYRFATTPPSVARDLVASTSTSMYSAKNPNKSKNAPTFHVPDSLLPPRYSILSRLQDALRGRLETLSDVPFPRDAAERASERLTEFEERLLEPMTAEAECYEMIASLLKATQIILGPIFEKAEHKVKFRHFHPNLVHSQVGDLQARVESSDTGKALASISFEMKRPAPLYRHGGGVYKERGGNVSHGLREGRKLRARSRATHASAMAIKLALQMLTSESRFGIFFAGYLFILAELVPDPRGGSVLVTSPLFSTLTADIPTNSESKLPTASLLACLGALCCQGMEGFAISKISGDDLRKVTEDIEAKTPDGDHDGDDGDGGDDVDPGAEDGTEHSEEDGTQGDSDHDTNKDGSHDWTPKGQSSKKQTSGQPTSPCKEAFSLALSSDLGNLTLSVIASKPPIAVAYDLPEYSHRPRIALPITFLPPSSLGAIPTPPPSPTSSCSHHELAPAVRDFLQSEFEEAKPPRFVLRAPKSATLKLNHIVLRDRLGEGRTGSVYRVVHKPESPHPPLVAKVFSWRHVASVERETLFYELFASMKTQLPVPKYYGMYVSADSGWYIMLLEDVGTPVEDYPEMFPPEDVRKLERAFKKAGIVHGDIRPSNILRAPDGSLRLVDFGFSRLIRSRSPV